jgi:uncharacterized iron-regulated membrane protein
MALLPVLAAALSLVAVFAGIALLRPRRRP